MKTDTLYRLLAVTALIAASTSYAFSQSDSLMNIRAQGSELRIEAAGYGITLGTGNPPQYSSSYRNTGHARVTTSLGIASFDLGFNILDNISYYGPWEGQGDFLDMRGGKSIRVAWEPAAVQIALDKSGIATLTAGIRLSADNYMFSEPYTLRTDNTGTLMPVKLDGYIKKSKLTAAYLGIPLRLSFTIGNKLTVSGYAAGDLLLKAHTKYKKPKTKDSTPGLSPFRVTAGGSLTFGNIGIYCDYGITPLFKNGTGSDAHTVSVGLRFGI